MVSSLGNNLCPVPRGRRKLVWVGGRPKTATENQLPGTANHCNRAAPGPNGGPTLESTERPRPPTPTLQRRAAATASQLTGTHSHCHRAAPGHNGGTALDTTERPRPPPRVSHAALPDQAAARCGAMRTQRSLYVYIYTYIESDRKPRNGN